MMNKKAYKPVHRKVWSPSELALLQRQDPKAFLLAKSHAKLARPSQAPSLLLEHERRLASRRTDFKPYMGAIMGALALAAGVALWPSTPAEAAPAAKMNIVSIPGPTAQMTQNQQALYWTYALYDFDRLREEFNISPNTVINHSYAEASLQALLPQIDQRTRFQINRYLPREVN